ncbi:MULTISPECIES: hypothetical protein [unclassified Ornithinimicrobium]|uniref:hypothetical protein n=1 Tax=unclassified Ornithinimicrobium TaxID=2615080 RepID=UPI003853B0E5
MTTAPDRLRTATDTEAPAPRPLRRSQAWGLVLLGVVLLLGLTVWGQVAADGRALVGSEVEHDGGRLVVTGAWTIQDPMMLMHPDDADRFERLGMQMGSAMISDAVPEGSKRVAVEMVVSAGEEGTEFPASDVTLTVDGQEHSPYLALLGDESLTPGAMINGVVVFEVPGGTGPAQFRLGPGTEPVHVDVSGGPGGGGEPHETDH